MKATLRARAQLKTENPGTKLHETHSTSFYIIKSLVGGLEHVLFFHSVGNFIIPINELIFFRGVGIPPTRNVYTQYYNPIKMACPKSPSSPGPGYEILICIKQDTSEALKIALLIGYCRELLYTTY